MHIEKDLSIISSNWLKKANFDLSNEKMAEAIFHKFKQKTAFIRLNKKIPFPNTNYKV